MKNIHNIISFSPSVSPFICNLPKRYINRYKRKYLGWLQGENRKLRKIFGDKNLMESVHRKISHSVWNCLSLSPALSPAAAPPLDFSCYAKFSHSHAKNAGCWISSFGFLPCISNWLDNLLPSLAKGYEVLQSSDSLCIWASTCIAIDFTKFSLILCLFQWSKSYQKH